MKCDADTYFEGVRSSTIHYRPRLEQLEKDIKEGKVKSLWCLDLDRLFRSQVEFGFFVQECLIPYGVNFHMGTFGEKYDLKNDDVLMILDIIARVKENQVKKQSQKSKLGKIYKTEEGVKKNTSPFLGGSPLFGYKNVNKKWRIHQEDAKWVRWIFDQYEKGTPTLEIKLHLDKSGVEPRRTIDGFWNTGTLQDMLKNKSYTGKHTIWEYERCTKFEYEENVGNPDLKSDEIMFVENNSVGGHNVYDKRGKVYRKRVNVRTFTVPQIIKIGQFKRVQKQLENNTKFHPNRKKHFSLLQNILFCECGNHYGSVVDYRTRPDGRIVNTRKYFCPTVNYNWKKGKKREDTCKNTKSLPMDMMNDFVVDLVKDRVSKSHILKEKFKKEILENNQQLADIKEKEKELEKQSVSITKDLENMETSLVDVEFEVRSGGMEQKMGSRLIGKFKKEIENKYLTLKDIEKEIDDLGKNRLWLDWVEKFGEEIKLKTSDDQKTKDFLQGIIENIVVHSEYDKKGKQVGHSFTFNFRMKIIDDKFEWIDKSVNPRTYQVSEGKKVDKSNELVRFIVPRTNAKKKQ